MKTAISVASILLCAFSLDAQITTTLNRLSNGMDEVRIRNNFASSLVAFVVTVEQSPRSAFSSKSPFVLYSDPLIEPATMPLLASEERMVMMRGVVGVLPVPPWATGRRGLTPDPSVKRVLEEPIVTAGIFADGATTGDAVLLNRLILRRSNMLQAVEITLETLSDAGRHNIPRGQLIEQFKKMGDSVRRWYLPPEQRVGSAVYQSMVGKLMNLPEKQVGSPFPPAAFIAQETAILNQQRVALVESQPSLADAIPIER